MQVLWIACWRTIWNDLLLIGIGLDLLSYCVIVTTDYLLGIIPKRLFLFDIVTRYMENEQ